MIPLILRFYWLLWYSFPELFCKITSLGGVSFKEIQYNRSLRKSQSWAIIKSNRNKSSLRLSQAVIASKTPHGKLPSKITYVMLCFWHWTFGLYRSTGELVFPLLKWSEYWGYARGIKNYLQSQKIEVSWRVLQKTIYQKLAISSAAESQGLSCLFNLH